MSTAVRAQITRHQPNFLIEYLGTAEQLLASGIEPHMLTVKAYGENSGWDSYGDKFFTHARRDGRFKVIRWMCDEDRKPWHNQRKWKPRWAEAERTVGQILENLATKGGGTCG